MLLAYLTTAFVVGILAASVARLPILVWALWLTLPLAAIVLFWRDSFLRRANFFALCFLLGAIRFAVASLPPDPSNIASLNGSGAMSFTGLIAEPPDVRNRSTQLRVSIESGLTQPPREITGLALVVIPREIDVQYGDVIEFKGAPTTPFETEDFSYKDYLARQGIHSLVRVNDNVRILARDQGNFFFTALYALRNRAYETTLALFPEPAASLLAGILLGIDSGIPADLKNAFSATNTAHIVAISGFNVSIIAGLLSQFARRIFSARWSAFVVIVGLAAYTLLAGASPSVVRAAIMGSLTVLATQVQRQNSVHNALAFAALGMCVFNPFTLWDVGFQLSFLATLGLVLYTDRLTGAFENFLTRLLNAERAKQIVSILSDSFIVTLAAQITTMPLILFVFHRFSLIGLFTNLLVLPAQPPLMIWGGLATILGMIFPPLGQLVAWIAWAFLEWTIVIVETTARLPLASFEVGRVNVWLIIGYYAVLFGATRLYAMELHRRIAVRPAFVAGAAFVLGLLSWNVYATMPDGRTRLAFVDAGSGATFIRTAHGNKILIDGGASPSALLNALGERLPIWDREIDLIVLTSADDDHLAGLVEVLERYAVKQIIQVAPPPKSSAAYVKWGELIAQKRVASAPAEPGLRLALDQNVTLEFLSPRGSVAQLRVGNVALLFAEGATVEEQGALVRTNVELGGGVLIAPDKMTREFFDAVNPRYAIVFAGRSARDKPSGELLTLLSRTKNFQTDERGTIEMIVDGQTISVRPAR